MKKLLMSLFLFSFLVISNSYADEVSKGGVSQQDAVAVKKGVEELGQLFGVEAPKKETPQQVSPTPTTEKTIAGVMDKAIEKVSDVVGVMAQAINKIAPDVWRIMIKQQYAKAIMNCVVPVGLLLVLFAYMKFIGTYWKPEKEEDQEKEDQSEFTEWHLRMCLVRILPIFLLCCAGLWFFNRLSDSIALLINPEFYAIQDFLRMILNKGM